jgi:hypothetical protein
MAWSPPYTTSTTTHAHPPRPVDDAPIYYQIQLANGSSVTPFDLAEALNFNFNKGCVLKYLCRAGRKGSEIEDLRKALNCLRREIGRLGAIP